MLESAFPEYGGLIEVRQKYIGLEKTYAISR